MADPPKSQNIANGKLMMDMIVMAMACDITRVATLQWTDTEAKHTFPWLNLPDHHHYYQHDGGFRPAECQKIYTWYAEQHAYLIDQLQRTETASGSLIVAGSGHPVAVSAATHIGMWGSEGPARTR